MNQTAKQLVGPEDIKGFLESGFFYRMSSQKVRIGWGLPSSASLENAQVAACPFWQNQFAPLKYPQDAELPVSDLLQALETHMAPIRGQAEAFEGPDRAKITQSFQATQGRIQREEIEKAVIIGTSSSKWLPSAAERATLVMNALRAQDSLYAYGFWSQVGGVIGISPEILFDHRGDEVQTMALAGSMPKVEQESRPPLLKDPKELREHKMVVQDLTDRLRGAGWLNVGTTEVIELPTLFHLRTLIEVKSCAKSDSEILALVHPTAAMAQFPRAYGLKWLREQPYQMDRELHGGVVWYRLAQDHTVAIVSIRSLYWNQQKSWMTAGCGVVKESQEDREWREMDAKLHSIRAALGIK